MTAYYLSASIGHTVLVYAVGILAMVLSVIAYQFRHRVTIILSCCFGQICWVLYFLLQSDYTSALACALSAIMLAVFSRKEKWKWVASNVTVIFFVLVISGFSLVTYKVWSDIFPIFAGIFAVVANSRTEEKRLRQIALLWCAFWLLNSIFKMYPIALINDALCTVSAALSLYRYRKKTKVGD